MYRQERNWRKTLIVEEEGSRREILQWTRRMAVGDNALCSTDLLMSSGLIQMFRLDTWFLALFGSATEASTKESRKSLWKELPNIKRVLPSFDSLVHSIIIFLNEPLKAA